GEMQLLSEAIAPDCGIITHIGKKHIATLKDLSTVASETAKLFACRAPTKDKSESRWTLIPDDPYLAAHIESLPGTSHFWNRQSHILPHASFSASEPSARMPFHINFPDGTTYNGQTSSGYSYFIDLFNISSKAAWLLGAPAQA